MTLVVLTIEHGQVVSGTNLPGAILLLRKTKLVNVTRLRVVNLVKVINNSLRTLRLHGLATAQLVEHVNVLCFTGTRVVNLSNKHFSVNATFLQREEQGLGRNILVSTIKRETPATSTLDNLGRSLFLGARLLFLGCFLVVLGVFFLLHFLKELVSKITATAKSLGKSVLQFLVVELVRENGRVISEVCTLLVKTTLRLKKLWLV